MLWNYKNKTDINLKKKKQYFSNKKKKKKGKITDTSLLDIFGYCHFLTCIWTQYVILFQIKS